MKKVLISAALVALMACTASAAGINMAWNDCPPTGSSNLSFLCNANTGSSILIGSYVPPPGLNKVNGNEFVIDIQTNQAALSQWWNMGNVSATPCPARAGTPTFDFNFLGGPFNCFDYWAGGASGGGGYLYKFNGVANRARIVGVVAIPEASAAPQAPDVEYYSFKVFIGRAGSAGSPPLCPGCTDAACLVLNSIKITQNTTETLNPTVTNPIISNFCTWQGGTPLCQATPARNSTWGSVKALYR